MRTKSDDLLTEIRDYIADHTAAEYVIFATQPYAVEETLSKLAEAGVKTCVLLGSYKGKQEPSFVAQWADFQTVVKLKLIDEQESVMVVSNIQKNGNRMGYLVFNENPKFLAPDPDQEAPVLIQSLGEITQLDAGNLPDAYTYDPGRSIYYGVQG